MIKYPGGLCEKCAKNDKEYSVYCDLCNSWVHSISKSLNFFDQWLQ